MDSRQERESKSAEYEMEVEVSGSDVVGPPKQAEVLATECLEATPQQQEATPQQQQATPQQQEATPQQQEATPQQQEATPQQQQATPQQQEATPQQQEATPQQQEATPQQQEATPQQQQTTPQQQEATPHPPENTTVDPSHVFRPEWSSLTKEEVVDKVKGTIYGQAIGDAIGLATEFMSKKQAAQVYHNGPSGYEDIVQDGHRSRWAKGDWTDDTDQMLLILKSIVESSGCVDKLDFAKRLHGWMKYGFSELGDHGGMGIGMTVHNTLTHEEFLKDPHKAAKDVWESSGCTLAANGAIMRTSILGLLDFNDLNKVIKNTLEICAVTHADPRCAASCVAMTTALALMLQGKYDPMKKEGNKALVEKALEFASEQLPQGQHKEQRKEMDKHIKSSLKDLKLDESSSIGYTFKALGAGFYGLRKATDFRKTIMELIMEGGDADSNGAVCGALMGCKLGFKALPQDLLQFKNRQWLDDRVDSFLRLMGLL